ncbi:MAG: tripartite tricarboxylate transporter substrate binding protein [Burkholderiales bacterium]
MRPIRCIQFVSAALGLQLAVLSSAPVLAETYPDKPITLYIGYSPGGTTDLSARGLAQGAEKLLGVAVVPENKAGGGATVAAGLLASKKPDGYTLAVVSTGVLSVRPQLLNLAYDPARDFTVLMQYSSYVGSLVVKSDAPWKTIDEFIDYAKKNPGMAYGSSGLHTQQQIAVEVLAQCKGLKFKHVPYKGGNLSNTALLGGHVQFAVGAGSHLPLVQQGAFRQLVIFHRKTRDPMFPDLPTLTEIGCPDNPALGYLVLGPKGMPDAVVKKLEDTFKKVAESAEFQTLLKNFNLPYDYKDQQQLAKDIPAETEWYKNFFQKIGAKKQ